ncbi:MAG TPA: head GIN domain-containing protein [Mucilaginibacter sp.]|nr:head GIN domain-containing protein [Mucilaginibacter sp.]
MKKLLSFIILFSAAASLSLLSSCRFGCIKGSGNNITENHKVGDFTRLEVSGGFRVNLKQDSSLNLSVTADDNLMKYIHIDNDGDRLHVYIRKPVCGSGEMILNVGIKRLEALKGSGAITFVSDGKLNTGDLRIGLSGASKVDLDLTAANVTTEGSGSSEIDLKGQATSHRLELTGAGKVHAFDFVVGKYDIHTTGASECEINVLNDLDVNTTGSSDVKYKGNPANVNSSKLGAGTLTHVN